MFTNLFVLFVNRWTRSLAWFLMFHYSLAVSFVNLKTRGLVIFWMFVLSLWFSVVTILVGRGRVKKSLDIYVIICTIEPAGKWRWFINIKFKYFIIEGMLSLVWFYLSLSSSPFSFFFFSGCISLFSALYTSSKMSFY